PPPDAPAPPFAESVRTALFERGGARWLGARRSEALWEFVRERAPLVTELCRSTGFVHGDFQGDNILVRKNDGPWIVAAILDWEWAHGGCRLEDVGSLLRSETGAQAQFDDGLERGFARAGAPLPAGWQEWASIVDLAALCEKLAFPRHRGDVTVRTIALCERCMMRYAK
ncbi:MAG TPA: phosphotransferase, partial [Xanthomonadales bacterium]|nr:phosphotransferase [Xanthomonadales bacterium]